MSEKLPWVSVCIPCIPTHVPFLSDCLSSIFQQTLLPEEIVIVISESTPIVEESVGKIVSDIYLSFPDKKIPIFHHFFIPKQYAGINRNLAVKATDQETEIIAFIDADDVMYPHRIATVKYLFHNFPSAVGLFHYFTENEPLRSEDEPKTYAEHTHSSVNRLLVEPYEYNELLHFGHACFKKTLFDKYQYTNKARGQDVEFAAQLLPEHRWRLLIYKDALTCYMSNRSSYLHNDKQMAQTESEKPDSTLNQMVEKVLRI